MDSVLKEQILSRRILVLFAFLFPIILFSQEHKIIYLDKYGYECSQKESMSSRVINYDANGKPVGIVYEYYANGDLKWKGKLLDDKPSLIFDSVCISYYHNGKQRYRSFYVNGKQEGNDSTFYYNGIVHTVIRKKSGNNDGPFLEYFRNGKPECKWNFVNGVAEGEKINYYESGKISAKSFYVRGKKEGKSESYFEDGKISEEANYVHDTVDGSNIEYFENGNIKSKRKFEMGNKIGIEIVMKENPYDTESVTYYSQNGMLQAQRYYSWSGKLESEETIIEQDSSWKKINYGSTGNILSFHHGKYDPYETEDGRQTDYFENGKLSEAKWMKDGGIIYDTTFYENGIIRLIRTGENEFRHERLFDTTGIFIAENYPDSVKLDIAKDNISCFYGLKDFHGRWIINPKYTGISELQNGFYLVDDNEKWGVLDLFGKEIISPQYESIEIISYYDDEYSYDEERNFPTSWDVFKGNNYVNFLVLKDSLYGLVNTANEQIIPIDFTFLHVYNDGKFDFLKNNYYGYGDTSGFISPAKYLQPLSFYGNNYAVFSNDSDNTYNSGKQGVIDYSGKIIVPPLYDNVVFHFRNDSIIWVEKNLKYGLFDIRGKKLLDTLYGLNQDPDYSTEYNYDSDLYSSYNSDTLSVITKNKKASLVSNTGNILLPFKYDSLSIIYDHCTLFYSGGKYGLLGENLKPLSKRRYSYVNSGCINSLYDDDRYEIANLIIAVYKGKFGAINHNDSIVIPFIYDNAWFENTSTIDVIKKDSLHVFEITDSNYWEELPVMEDVDDAPIERFTALIKNGNQNEYAYSEGVKKANGKIILQPGNEINYVGPNLIIYKNAKEKTCVLVPGQKPILLSEKFINPEIKNAESIYVTTASGKVGVINSEGKRIVDTIFYGIGFYESSTNAYWVKTIPFTKDPEKDGGGWGLLTGSGKYILEPVWESPVEFSDSIEIIKGISGYGIVGRSGKIILEPQYDEIIKSENSFYITMKDSLYGFTDAKGKIIVAPKWKKVTGFMGDLIFCYDQNGNVELVNENGATLESGNIYSTLNWKVNLPTAIKFYSEPYLFSRNNWSYDHVLAISKVIPGYDQLMQSSLSEQNKKRVANYFVALSASDYTDFDNESENYYRRWTPYCSADINFNRSAIEQSSYDYEVFFIGACKNGFTMVYKFSDCPRRNFYSGCTKQTEFLNYQFCGDSICQILLEDIFDTTKNYKAFLTEIITQKMQATTDPGISCSEPSTYMRQIGEKFSITDSTIILYMPKSYSSPGSFNENDYLSIEIPFTDVKGILNKNRNVFLK